MLDAFEKRLRMEIRSKHYSMVNADTACHQLYGFKVALEQLGLLDIYLSVSTRSIFTLRLCSLLS